MNNEIIKIASENIPVVTSFYGTTVAEKKKYYTALNAPVGDVKDIVNRPITITDYHMAYEERTDTEGVTYGRITTTIVLEDGASYVTTYKSFAKSLVQLLSVFGQPDTWDDHKMQVCVKTVTYTGGMHDGLRIDLV